MQCEYIRNYYGVPAVVGQKIEYRGDTGVIYKDGGNYLCVNMDTDKPGHTLNIHPTDPNLKYLQVAGNIRKLSRSQQNYRDYLKSECSESFAEFMGFACG